MELYGPCIILSPLRQFIQKYVGKIWCEEYNGFLLHHQDFPGKQLQNLNWTSYFKIRCKELKEKFVAPTFV
jgi:hypothetical protein